MSFSHETKDFLLDLEIKSKCCQKSFEQGKTADIPSTATCDSCARHFARGLFIAHGSVTDPASGYHLELAFKDEDKRDETAEYLSENAGVAAKKSKRKSAYILYIKDSGAIEDFLAFIGANKAAFSVMNGKILKDLRNNTNRLVNSETANIDKAISASRKHIEMIKELKSSGEFSKLPAELQRTADLRIEYEELPLNELGLKMEPSISKSGVNHRLTKIAEYYEKYILERESD
jgi:conserved hypothetical protein